MQYSSPNDLEIKVLYSGYLASIFKGIKVHADNHVQVVDLIWGQAGKIGIPE
jgi:hypothetical protein